MAIKLPSHLHRSRSGILHFRIAIPPDLRHHFASREIYRSLRTASVTDAKQTAQTFSIAFKRVFDEIRHQSMSTMNKQPDPAKLRELTLLTKQRLKFEDKIEAQEERIAKAEQCLRVAERQHERELGLVREIARLSSVGTAASGDVGLQSPLLIAAKLSPLFSELVHDFRRDRLARGRWLPSSEKEYMPIYQLFIEIAGDLPLNAIDDDVALTYVETLKKLPANMNKMPMYRGKSINEIIALNPPPRAARTINKSIERISSLFKFATSKPKYELSYNPFSGQSLDESDSQHREPFTADELISLFSADEHAHRKYKTAYSYWLPLMGMFTGARLNELCQLHLSDFEIFDGVHCINIQDEEEGQRVKNKSAKRHVPIHDKLVEAGLIRYVNRLRNQGEERLFPTLKWQEKGGFGAGPSKWFSRFKERCGILEKQTKVFHSFRHTFISSLLDDDVPETSIAPIVGHEGKLVTSQVYWNKKDPVKRKPTVEKFQPPAELWRLVPKFEDVTIAKGG